jgi:hypothetical protein
VTGIVDILVPSLAVLPDLKSEKRENGRSSDVTDSILTMQHQPMPNGR